MGFDTPVTKDTKYEEISKDNGNIKQHNKCMVKSLKKYLFIFYNEFVKTFKITILEYS